MKLRTFTMAKRRAARLAELDRRRAMRDDLHRVRDTIEAHLEELAGNPQMHAYVEEGRKIMLGLTIAWNSMRDDSTARDLRLAQRVLDALPAMIDIWAMGLPSYTASGAPSSTNWATWLSRSTGRWHDGGNP